MHHADIAVRLSRHELAQIEQCLLGLSCSVIGVKPTYGWDSKNAALLGSQDSNTAGFETNDIKLAAGEFVNKVVVSATSG